MYDYFCVAVTLIYMQKQQWRLNSKFKFLPKRIRLNPVLLATLPLIRPGARGINRRKKKKLIKALMPLMHAYPWGEQRALFY